MEEMHKASENGLFICAFYLGSIAWEEYGKAFLILENWDKEKIDREMWKNKFTRHRTKMGYVLRVSDRERRRRDSMLGMDFGNKDLKESIDEDFLKSIDDIRDSCRYIDFDFEEEEWKSPLDVDDKLRSWTRKIGICLWWANKVLKIEKQKKGILD